MTTHTAQIPTPIFDSVMADQKVEIMPPPAHASHEEFMRRSGQDAFMSRAELILRGGVTEKPKKQKKAVG